MRNVEAEVTNIQYRIVTQSPLHAICLYCTIEEVSGYRFREKGDGHQTWNSVAGTMILFSSAKCVLNRKNALVLRMIDNTRKAQQELLII